MLNSTSISFTTELHSSITIARLYAAQRTGDVCLSLALCEEAKDALEQHHVEEARSTINQLRMLSLGANNGQRTGNLF
jgi:hypothetical protein